MLLGGAKAGWQVASTVEEYDPEVDTWTERESMPSPRYYPFSAVFKGRIYVIGGYKASGLVPSFAVEVFDPVLNEWEKLDDMPVHNGAGFACAGGEEIYLVGGTAWPGLVAFDPESEKWTNLAGIPTPRFSLSGALIDGKIYAIAGMDFAENNYSTVEVYDVSLGKWIRLEDMPSRRGFFGNSSVVNGKLYIIGGTSNWDWGLSTNEEYTPGDWRSISISPAKKETSAWGWIKQNRE